MNLMLNIGLAAILSAVLIKLFIPVLRRLKFGQNIRTDGPQSHLSKSGTPTMGGLVFVPLALAIILIIGISKEALAILFLTFGYFVVGFIDDYLKVVKKENEGFKVKQKLVAQILISIIFIYFIANSSTTMLVPFFNTEVDMSYFYLGFLFHNKKPAKLFMGDTGSLALGGLVSGLAIYLKIPFIIIIVGIIYLVNATSVIIQVAYYKKTKKRFFKMAPLHHHFELCGYSENTIVVAFALVTIFFASIGYYATIGLFN